MSVPSSDARPAEPADRRAPPKIPLSLFADLVGAGVEIVAPGLWKARSTADLDLLSGAEPSEEPGLVWLRFDPDVEAPTDRPVHDLSLPPEVRFLAPRDLPPDGLPLHPADLPGELVSADPVLLYHPVDGDLPEDEAWEPWPVPGAVIRLEAGRPEAPLVPSWRMRCRVAADGHEWTVEVAPDADHPGEGVALCPRCDAPADRWYRCPAHGPHCSAHRKVCRSCRRGECLECFTLACGSCEIPLCPECASPPCPGGGGPFGPDTDAVPGRAEPGRALRASGAHGSCSAHRAECGECHRTHCLACSAGTCAVGEDALCAECAGTCAACGRVARARLLAPCHGCGAAVCPGCARICHLDGRSMCPSHGVDCPTCSRPVCEGHRETCPSCGSAHCRMHLEPCAACARPSCPACLQQGGSCAQCRSLRGADEDLMGRLEALGAGRPWARFSAARSARSPAGWLFALDVGLSEWRVATDPDLTAVRSEHRRGLLARMLKH